MPTRTDRQFPKRLRRDRTQHGATPLFERMHPMGKDAKARTMIDCAALLVSSSLSIAIFWLFRNPLTVLALLATVSLLISASLRSQELLALFAAACAAAAACWDVHMLVYLLPLAALLGVSFYVCRDFSWSRSTIPVRLDDLITSRRPWASLRRLITVFCGCLIPLTLVCLRLSGDDRLFALAGAYRSVRMLCGVIALIYFVLPPQGKFGVTLKAVRHWFTYNERDTNQPGIFQSPAGPLPKRILVANLLVILLGAPEAYPPMLAFEPMLTEFAPSLMQMPLSAIPMPLVTCVLAIVFLARTRLLEAEQMYQAAVQSGNEWESINERQRLYQTGSES